MHDLKWTCNDVVLSKCAATHNQTMLLYPLKTQNTPVFENNCTGITAIYYVPLLAVNIE